MCKNSDWQLQEWLEQQNDFRMSVNIFCQVQTFFFKNPITKNWHSSETSVFSVCSVSMIPIQKHMNLQRANILSTHPISLSLPLCFPGIHPPPRPPTHTGARSADQSLWIRLMAPRAPLLTKVLPKMMSYWEIMLGCYFNCRMLMHFVNADL